MPVIPAIWEAEIGRMNFKANLVKKVNKTLSQRISWVWSL
jgi:hypothetical protein